MTIDERLEDSLLAPLCETLMAMTEKKPVTPALLEEYRISESDMKLLSPEMQARLTWGIHLHKLLSGIKRLQCNEDMDASCAGIMFCKIMESMLKEKLLGKLQALFPDQKTNRGKLRNLKASAATIGTFAFILKNEAVHSELVSRKVSLFEQVCDEQWWKVYTENLEEFQELRNCCSHSDPLSWQQAEQIVQIMFERRELVKTLVGDAL